MRVYEDRPYVVCHVISSLDGRIDGEFFASREMARLRPVIADVRRELACDAIIAGSVTAGEVYAAGDWEEENPERNLPREDRVAPTGLRHFIVCLDPEGTLRWEKDTVIRPGQPRAHVVVLLTEMVSDGYLAHLKAAGVSYLFAGEQRLNLSLAMRKLKDRFQIDSALLTGGGAADYGFLQAGLLDELVVMMAPLASGDRDAATIFDRSFWTPEGSSIAFSLEELKKLPGDAVLLRYRAKNARGGDNGPSCTGSCSTCGGCC